MSIPWVGGATGEPEVDAADPASRYALYRTGTQYRSGQRAKKRVLSLESILKERSSMRGKTRYRIIAGTCVAWLVASAIYCPPPLEAQSAVPKYEVDPFWAKLPDN